MGCAEAWGAPRLGVQREELAQGLGVSHGSSGNPRRFLGDLTLRVGRMGSWEDWPSGFLIPLSSNLSTGPAATQVALRESSTLRSAEELGGVGAEGRGLRAGWASLGAKGTAGARPHPILGSGLPEGQGSPPAEF